MANDKVFLILEWQDQKFPSFFYDCDCRLPFSCQNSMQRKRP